MGYSYSDPAASGTLDGLGKALTETLINNGGSSRQAIAIAIPAAPTANATYKIKLDPGIGSATYTGFAESPNITAHFLTGEAPSQEELAIGLSEAILGTSSIPSSRIMDYLEDIEIDNPPTTLTLLAREAGINHTVSAIAEEGESLPAAALGISVTSPGAKGLEIPFGRFVGQNSTMKQNEISLLHAGMWIADPIVRGVALIGLVRAGDHTDSRPNYQVNQPVVVCQKTTGQKCWVQAAHSIKWTTAATQYYIHLDISEPEKNGTLTTIATNNQQAESLQIAGSSVWAARQKTHIIPVYFSF